MSHELIINSPRRMCCGLTANECACRPEPVAELEPEPATANRHADEPGMAPGLDWLFSEPTGNVVDMTGQGAPRTAAPAAADPPGYNPAMFGRGLPVVNSALLDNNPLTANERMDVMPTLNGDYGHLFDTGLSDDDAPRRREPAPKRLGTFDPVANEGELTRLLFGQ